MFHGRTWQKCGAASVRYTPVASGSCRRTSDCHKHCSLTSKPLDTADTGRNAGIGIGVALLVLAAAAGVAIFLKRRKADKEVLRKQASAYNDFQDGMDGDEMQRSATVTSVGLDDSKGAMQAASATAYVRDANADVTIEQN